MEILLIVLIIALIAAVAGLAYVVLKKQGTAPANDAQSLVLLQNQIQSLMKTVDEKLSRTHEHLSHTIQEQHGQNMKLIQGVSQQSARSISDITEKLTSLEKTNQQVIGFSEQLGNLEKVLKSQKQRGNLGEAGLQLILENILPPGSFELQYHFKDGDIVDAAIKTRDGLIPVDAKFSLDNYQKLINEDDPVRRSELEKFFKADVKKRIDETSKYIKPKEGTLDFAFMFIPTEAIYYDLLINEVGAVKVNTRDLLDYAYNQKKVIIVSPTTFAAYLQTVLYGLRAMKIEEGAKEIRKNVEQLGKHMAAYEEYFRKLGTTIGTSVSHYNAAYKELGKIDKDVVKIAGGAVSMEPLQLDKPAVE